ncbi:MAG TPA: hypothetical protein VFS44_07030 [Gemmatimonadaceae bacterium]|nr:hypothetical protein [Gemmatimonadaceae bacterium]
MGTKKIAVVLPMTLLALACGKAKQPQSAALSDDLRSDLARAAAPTSDLASTQFRPQQVVSNIELGNAPAPHAAPPKVQRHPAPRARPLARRPTVQAVKTEAPEPSPTPTTVAVTPAPEPTAGPRPMPNPVNYPAGNGSDPQQGDHHPGGGIGAVIGVILRGGGIGDDDHCEIHPGRGGIAINSRIPIPVGRPTFPGGPRGGW